MELKPLLLLVFTTMCLATGTPIGDHPVINITAVQHENVLLPSTTVSISDTWKFSATERHLLLFEYKQNEMVFDVCGQLCTILIEAPNNTHKQLTPLLRDIQLNDGGPYRVEWYPYPLIPLSVKHLDIYLHVTEGLEMTTPSGTTAAAPALYTADLPAVFQVLVAIGAIITLMA